MRDRTPRIAVLIAIGLLGCDRAYPTPIGFGDLDGGIDAGGPGAGAGSHAAEGPSGAAGRPGGQAGQPGQPGQAANPTGGAAGAGAAVPPPTSPFTCPGCAGLCIFGFCLAAPPPGSSAGGDSAAGTGEDDSDDSQPECTDCEDDDDCCPSDCDANNDSDCTPSCGNSEVEEDETCDPPGSCASTCDDSESCTSDLSMGSADECTFACAHTAISECGASEGCCPGGCGPTTDVDCPGCGNGHVEDGLGETCDPPGSCTCADDDVCTHEVTTGSADACTLVCTHQVITACEGGDGCCAGGCGPTTDSDCPGCGNGRIELDLLETCDPPGTCTCEDHDACTADIRGGTPSNCDVTCAHVPITACSNTSDGCCPSGCTFDNDSDCAP